jgi:phage shock protein C
MIRSFTDHILGGICGGLAYALRVNAWVIRGLFVLLSILSSGAVALFYLALWWTMPRESALETQQRRSPLPALILILIALALTGARLFSLMQGPEGQDVLFPGMLVIVSGIFLLRQLRG